MKYFLSCDWGTTSFRLRLADAADGKILAEESSGEGIAAAFELWKQSGGQEEKRISFYLDVIARHIKKLEENIQRSLKGVKLVISGMVSSSIGFFELPYADVPLPADGSGLKTGFIAADKTFEHDVLIISGVKTADDVMRGEETQLIGCIEPGQDIKYELFIFPGTHSKHITVKDNQVAGIKTYMTGELFSLLVNNSILKNNVEPGTDDMDSFKKGVADSQETNLLHTIFKVRTNQLFDIYSKTENYNYLSGLLIGAELKDIIASDAGTISLACGQDLGRYYQIALKELLPAKSINIFSAQQAGEATVKGQLKIGNHLQFFA